MRIIGLLAILMLSGCATRPVSNEDARDVPDSRLLTQQWRTPTSSSAPLTVKRDRGLMGAACKVELYVDGIAVAAIGTGEKVVVHLPAGEHLLGARPSGICGGGTAEASTVMQVGRPRNFRISSGQSGDLDLQPTAF